MRITVKISNTDPPGLQGVVKKKSRASSSPRRVGEMVGIRENSHIVGTEKGLLSAGAMQRKRRIPNFRRAGREYYDERGCRGCVGKVLVVSLCPQKLELLQLRKEYSGIRR